MEFYFQGPQQICIARMIYFELCDLIEKYGSISIVDIYDVYSTYTLDFSYQPTFVQNRYGYTDNKDIHLTFKTGNKYDAVRDEYIRMDRAKLWFSEPKLLR